MGRKTINLCILLALGTGVIMGGNLDTIGVAPLQEWVPGLQGSGVPVAQPEAGTPLWQIDPTAVGQPSGLFRWHSQAGTATEFPNSLGQKSTHAVDVGVLFYGAADGIVPEVGQVDNYEADYFLNEVIPSQTAIAARVVNQSFAMDLQSTAVDQNYDNFVAKNGSVMVTGVGNSGAPRSPATAYNSIGVGSSTAIISIGPATDGRCKPDLSAPGAQASFTAPLVTGCATILYQAGQMMDEAAGGVSNAVDARTIKALLLNGSEKPPNWTNTTAQPLDFRYGAGVVNVFNSYRQLRGGKQAWGVSTTMRSGEDHPPASTGGNVLARRGWDLNSIENNVRQDRVNHYFFDLRNATNRLFEFKASLVWHRQMNRNAINDLDLFLYDSVSGELIASSQSAVDNVEHLFVQDLPPSRYNLQVFKSGQLSERETAGEIYALAFDFGPPESARITDIHWLNSEFQALIQGEPYAAYVIEASSNFTNWVPLQTNTLPESGLLDFVHSFDDSANVRFYRAVLAP